MLRSFLIALASVFLLASISLAAAPVLVKGSTPAGKTALLVAGSKATVAKTSKFSLAMPTGAKTARLLLKNSDGSLAGGVVVAIKKGSKYYTLKEAKSKRICNSATAKAVMGVKLSKGTLNVSKITYDTGGFGYLKNLIEKKSFSTTSLASVSSTCAPLASGNNLGLVSPADQAIGSRVIKARAAGDGVDGDGDGLPDVFDADADNDGVLNAYDTTSGVSGTNNLRFFSNLKVNLEDSLNVDAGDSVTSTLIDNLVSQHATLAIAVAGNPSDSVELDGGGLPYCSLGGTGQDLNSHQAFPANFDSDSDGKGTIVRGGTGDFQLFPGATASQIGAGDILTEVVNEGTGTEQTVSGMLNFIFNTTPAVKDVQVNSDTSVIVNYPAHPGDPGTSGHCFVAPATGPVTLSIIAWRPQRPGISGAGEPAYMDVGNSLITIDMPNSPCVVSGGGGCGGNGAGNCSAASYSSADPNIVADPNGLKDTEADAPASVSNTFSFSIDVVQCLADANGGPISWNSGETVYLDLQMRNSVGDNAAQKFCVTRQ